MKAVFQSIPLVLLASGAFAQTGVISASPIPERAETRFCYYAGLNYSLHAYIILTGSNNVTRTSNQEEQALLQCVKGQDGVMSWDVKTNLKLGR